ncbi:hypothetical protein OH76DRAFT_1421152 [Lentinus brumalis]|uniref:Uncharacterized protein n=1 Tax=Lentinus brumalis TaxID=2498619 RepID=A0A371CWX4_9APHY|nr:hypothetical protein OH76DRAFT_1421152 [Polyporus brumalis]
MTTDRTPKPGHSVPTESPSLTVGEWIVRLLELGRVWNRRMHDLHSQVAEEADGASSERQLWEDVSPNSTFLAEHLPAVLGPVPSSSSSSTPVSHAVGVQNVASGSGLVHTHLCLACPVHGHSHDAHAVRDTPLHAQDAPSATESVVDSLDEYSIDDEASDMTNSADSLYALPDPDPQAPAAVAQAPPVVAQAPPIVAQAPPVVARAPVVAQAPIIAVAQPAPVVVQQQPTPVVVQQQQPAPVVVQQQPAPVVFPQQQPAPVVVPQQQPALVVVQQQPAPVAVPQQPAAAGPLAPAAAGALAPAAAVAPAPPDIPAYTPFFAPISDAPMCAVMVHSVSRVSGGAGRGGFATRDAAIARFRNAEVAGVVKQNPDCPAYHAAHKFTRAERAPLTPVMGRDALYYTAEDRRLAKLEQARSYRSSAKGRATKAVANHRQYKRRQEAVAAVLLVGPSTPPLMGLWTPPYRYVPVPARDLSALPTGDNLWNSTAASLGTYQQTELTEAAHARYERWVTQSEDIIGAEVCEEVGARITSWRTLWLSEQHAPRVDEVKQVALDWGATIVCLLLTEWECRMREGPKGYEAARSLGLLPWQARGKAFRRLFEAEIVMYLALNRTMEAAVAHGKPGVTQIGSLTTTASPGPTPAAWLRTYTSPLYLARSTSALGFFPMAPLSPAVRALRNDAEWQRQLSHSRLIKSFRMVNGHATLETVQYPCSNMGDAVALQQ